MLFKDLEICNYFETDALEDELTYIPTEIVECGWDGSDFRVHTITRRNDETNSDIIVYALDGDEQGGYVAFPHDTDLKLYVYGIIAEL